MKGIHLSRSKRRDYLTYLLVVVLFFAVFLMDKFGILNRSQRGMLVPICAYIVMAISLNLTVGIMGELSLGHAGFMSIGAFTGVVVSMSLQNTIASTSIRLFLSILIGAIMAGIFGFLIGIPVLRLKGDYLAIVTLAFGEIIVEIINCLIVGYDANGLHVLFNFNGSKTEADLHLLDGGTAIIKGAQGAVGVKIISTYLGGFILIMITLIIIQNLIRSRSGRAIMAIRDNSIAAESVGINLTKYKMLAFILSTAMAGAAGALFSLNYSSISAVKFDYNTSILVLLYVVLGGLGNIGGSIIATIVLYILPEALRGFAAYRMFIYAILLIVIMLVTNNEQSKDLLKKIIPGRKAKERDN